MSSGFKKISSENDDMEDFGGLFNWIGYVLIISGVIGMVILLSKMQKPVRSMSSTIRFGYYTTADDIKKFYETPKQFYILLIFELITIFLGIMMLIKKRLIEYSMLFLLFLVLECAAFFYVGANANFYKIRSFVFFDGKYFMIVGAVKLICYAIFFTGSVYRAYIREGDL